MVLHDIVSYYVILSVWRDTGAGLIEIAGPRRAWYVLYKTAIESQDSRLELVRLMISGIFKNSFDDEDVGDKDDVSADYNDDDNDDVGDGGV